jgi:hypothetical protein
MTTTTNVEIICNGIAYANAIVREGLVADEDISEIRLQTQNTSKKHFITDIITNPVPSRDTRYGWLLTTTNISKLDKQDPIVLAKDTRIQIVTEGGSDIFIKHEGNFLWLESQCIKQQVRTIRIFLLKGYSICQKRPRIRLRSRQPCAGICKCNYLERSSIYRFCCHSDNNQNKIYSRHFTC